MLLKSIVECRSCSIDAKGLANFLLRPDGKPVSTKPTKRKREKATGGEEGEEGEGEGEVRQQEASCADSYSLHFRAEKSQRRRKRAVSTSQCSFPVYVPFAAFLMCSRPFQALATFVGKETMSRPELVKFITAYVKEKNLKDPKDGRVILFDEKLQEVFGTKKTTFFKINRLLNNHVAPLEQ